MPVPSPLLAPSDLLAPGEGSLTFIPEYDDVLTQSRSIEIGELQAPGDVYKIGEFVIGQAFLTSVFVASAPDPVFAFTSAGTDILP